MTNDIYRRVSEHKDKKFISSFSSKYNLDKLVYYEVFGDIRLAIKREKQLKNWHREWKGHLINESNPDHMTDMGIKQIVWLI